MGSVTLEPMLYGLFNKTAKHLLSSRYKVGGGKQDRTADLLHAMQALSQLSYTPLLRIIGFCNLNNTLRLFGIKP